MKKRCGVQETGLRGRELGLVVGALCVLALLALLTFLGNLFIILYLGMGPRGMAHIQVPLSSLLPCPFVDEGMLHQMLRGESGESVVRFLGGPAVRLDSVLARNGVVGGHAGKPLTGSAYRVQPSLPMVDWRPP